MPTTSEDRDKHALCGAKGRSGTPCRAYAGQGTDHPGIGKCRHHGGSTPTHKKHAVAVEAKRQMVKMGQPIEGMDPARALMGLLRSTAGHVAWLNAEIQELDELSSPEGETLMRLYDAERDRLTRVGIACVQAGATEAEVRLAQAEMGEIIATLQEAFDRAEVPREYQGAVASAIRLGAAERSGDTNAEELRAIFETKRDLARTAYDTRVRDAAALLPPEDLAYPPEEWVPGDATDS